MKLLHYIPVALGGHLLRPLMTVPHQFYYVQINQRLINEGIYRTFSQPHTVVKKLNVCNIMFRGVSLFLRV